MAAMRIPLWLKIGWTIWVMVWVPVYWKPYGLQNFLFFCDLGNIVSIRANTRLTDPILLTFQMFSVCKDFFMASMRPRLLVELSQA